MEEQETAGSDADDSLTSLGDDVKRDDGSLRHSTDKRHTQAMTEEGKEPLAGTETTRTSDKRGVAVFQYKPLLDIKEIHSAVAIVWQLI